MLGRSARFADSSPLLGPGSRRRTRYVRCAHCAQTAAPSQTTKRATRAAMSPALLGASQARPSLPARGFAPAFAVLVALNANTSTTGSTSRQAVRGGGDFWG